MSEFEIHRWVCWGMIGAGALVALALVFITAPYGRHEDGSGGPTLPARWGWILMESPAVLGFCAIYALGEHRGALVPLVLLAVWQAHYVHRTFIYPFRIRSSGKRLPWAIALSGAVFNIVNAYVNARWISHLGAYTDAWLADPRFIGGVLLFAGGLVLNIWSDTVLINLRRPGQTGYVIPDRGPHRLVAAPNYLGELIEWLGWALMTWSLAGLAFALFTACNLVPRAVAHRRWYREKFPDYPPERKAMIPFVF